MPFEPTSKTSIASSSTFFPTRVWLCVWAPGWSQSLLTDTGHASQLRGSRSADARSAYHHRGGGNQEEGLCVLCRGYGLPWFPRTSPRLSPPCVYTLPYATLLFSAHPVSSDIVSRNFLPPPTSLYLSIYLSLALSLSLTPHMTGDVLAKRRVFLTRGNVIACPVGTKAASQGHANPG